MSALCVTLLSSRGSILYAPSSPTSLERGRRSSFGRCSSSGKSSSSTRKLSVVNQAVPDGVRYGTFQSDFCFPLTTSVCAHALALSPQTRGFWRWRKELYVFWQKSRAASIHVRAAMFASTIPQEISDPSLIVYFSLSLPLAFILTCRITFTCCVLVLSLFLSKTLSSC